MTPYERALLEQITYLEAELARYRRERPKPLPSEDDPPIAWAMTCRDFVIWREDRRLLRQRLEEEARP